MKQILLNAKLRSLTGKKVKRLREKGEIPGVVYGHGTEPRPITLDGKEFRRVYESAGTGTLVDVKIEDEKPIKVLLHEPQPHYLTGQPIHADLYAVKMDEKIETNIPIHFVGTSAAVEEKEGNFVTNKNEITIRCLPGDLIPSVEVDISVLKTFDDIIRVSDLAVPESVEIVDDSEDVVALVSPPRSEEELEAELAEDKEAEAAAVEELGKEAEDETSEPEEEAQTPADQPEEKQN